jgi:hypothetical protein
MRSLKVFAVVGLACSHPNRVGLDRAGGALGGVAGVHDPQQTCTQARRGVKEVHGVRQLITGRFGIR